MKEVQFSVKESKTMKEALAAHPRLDEILQAASRRIAPLWPLKTFVAVNPFLGLLDQSFGEAAWTMKKVVGAKMTMPRSFYLEKIKSGRISNDDLAAALENAPEIKGLPNSVEAMKAHSQSNDSASPAVWPTVADVATEVTGIDWSSFTTERISSWAADRFDEGEAPLRSPWQGLALFDAWRAEASIDRTPEVMGVSGFRKFTQSLPAKAEDAVKELIAALHVPSSGLEHYLHRLLMSISGWSGYARYQVWQSELKGRGDDTLIQLLAIRLAWEVAILRGVSRHAVTKAWLNACSQYEKPRSAGETLEMEIDSILQRAYEGSWQRQLLSKLPGNSSAQAQVPAIQAAFCIDVRSEVIRRSLESLDGRIETLGFAGFFGFLIDYLPFGESCGGARCPVLLSPSFTIVEGLDGGDEKAEAAVKTLQNVRIRMKKAWKSFKFAAVSCFGFVGPIGWLYAFKLITDSLGMTRAVPHPSALGIGKAAASKLKPNLSPSTYSGLKTGLSADQQIAVAEQVLRGMSMIKGFARVILLAGHGSSTVNNAHASGLDCGACGGHSGEANARVGAAVLNNQDVRKALEKRGISIPSSTVFIAGLHNTATDEVALYDHHLVPESHGSDIAQLKKWLSTAARLTREERAKRLLFNSPSDVHGDILARSRDWSQVRPEWGLAGCAAFIAAPRERTRGVSLGGRAFLHNYDWHIDNGYGVLELIMTAPMVVASWISLQYYGSTVDNQAFGCGNKTLHNVAGTIGVFEGNGGDLRSGLSWQSVHDGEKIAHEPLRLSVVIEAPRDAMSDIIKKHDVLRQLLDNEWLYLFAMDESGKVSHRYAGNLTWNSVES